MAHSKQAKKRIRQNETRRLRNKSKASTMKTLLKKVRGAVDAGDKKQAEELLPLAFKHIDKAAKCRIIHPNAAARHKSQVARLVKAMG